MKPTAAGYEALLSLIEPLTRETEELQQRLAEIEIEKAPLDAALKELRPGKKGRTKAKSKAAKPSASKANVHAACLALVKTNPGISKDELKELAKHKLSHELGFDLRGFELRLKECLASDTFSISADESVSIVATTSKQVPDKATLPVESLPFSKEVD